MNSVTNPLKNILQRKKKKRERENVVAVKGATKPFSLGISKRFENSDETKRAMNFWENKTSK